MSEPISYKEASSMIFINREKKDTHTFLGYFGACWPTKKLRAVMRKSKLYFADSPFVKGHKIIMETPEGKIYRIETSDRKVEKWRSHERASGTKS